MMGTRVEKVVVSGPGPDGQWFWRPIDGVGDTQAVDKALVDPEWDNADVVEMRVRHDTGRIELVGPPEGSEVKDALVLLNGEPLELPDDKEIEPGNVVYALVQFSRPGDRIHRDHVAKRRPAVVVEVEGEHLLVRPIFSKNTEGRGRRLRDPVVAGLSTNSIVGDDGEDISRSDVSGWIGRLAAVDAVWVLPR